MAASDINRQLNRAGNPPSPEVVDESFMAFSKRDCALHTTMVVVSSRAPASDGLTYVVKHKIVSITILDRFS
jgi:hypothetical protein